MVRAAANALIEKYHTRDPFELAHFCGIVILEEPLGAIHGFYSRSHRQRFIHLNCALDEYCRAFTCSHELGHAVLHPAANTPFLQANTLFPVNRYEIEANRFAVQLLYADDELQDMLEWPIEHVARFMGVPVWLAEYRMRSVEPKFRI